MKISLAINPLVQLLVSTFVKPGTFRRKVSRSSGHSSSPRTCLSRLCKRRRVSSSAKYSTVCTENLIQVDDVIESPKLAE